GSAHSVRHRSRGAMTYVQVVLSVLVLVGCTTAKPPAPPSTTTAAQSAPPVAPPPASPPQPESAPPPTPPAQAAGPPPPAAGAPPAPSAPQAQPAPGPPPSVAAPVAPTPKIVYVKVRLANLRAGASATMKILRVLRQGTRLEILEERNDWLRVRVEDGQEGW